MRPRYIRDHASRLGTRQALGLRLIITAMLALLMLPDAAIDAQSSLATLTELSHAVMKRLAGHSSSAYVAPGREGLALSGDDWVGSK